MDPIDVLTADDVQAIGLKIMGVRLGRRNQKRLELEFHKHFGSSPLVVSTMWFDLCNYKNELSTRKKSEIGFRRFLSAHYWLWCRPKNTALFASRFGMCEDYCRGKHLWKWILRLKRLAKDKIKWSKKLDAKDTAIFGITTDGVDFKLWERQHEKYPFDRKNMSHKFKACAAKYLIALSTYEAKCVFIAGPYRGGMGDLEIFKECGLLEKLERSGKIAIADRGFRSKYAEERKQFAYPDLMDSKELNNLKSRACLRQETFNRRLKHFDALLETWKHGWDKHEDALWAVAGIVQYQMDLGSPIYCVG
jgi:DDE superfamily endonuclease